MADLFDDIHRLLKQKNYDKVLSMLLAEDGVNIKSPYDHDLNHAWYIVGDVLYKLENFEGAIEAFKRALEEWPDDAEASLALSNSYSENNMPKDAELVIKTALAKNPKSETLKYNLANALFDQKQWDEAISLYAVIKDDLELRRLARKNMKMAKENKANK